MRKIIKIFPLNLSAVFAVCTSLLISGCDQDSIGPLKGSLEGYSSSSYDGCQFNLKRDIEFHRCEESAYYEGHGVEALKTDDLSDYLQNGLTIIRDATPIAQWTKGVARDFVRDILLSDRVKQRGIYNFSSVERAIDGEREFGRVVWGLLCLELWHRVYIDGDMRHHG